jgi:F-type H+-transporting ATPase subunit a
MITTLAEAVPGTHPTITVCHVSNFICTFNYDTLISSALAILVTLAIGFGVAFTLRRGTPHRLQMIFELLLSYIRNLTSETVDEDAAFILPLAATIFFFILFANWLDFFPLVAPLEPANADINLTLAMALVVIVIVEWYSVHVLGWKKFFYRYTHPFDAPIAMRIVFVPINIITEIAKPISLALRLFGNIFGGVVVVYLLTLAFRSFASSGGVLADLSPLPVIFLAGWKIFDVFLIGTIQAFIFMLLTIIYFGMAREGLHEEREGHREGATAHA